MTLARRFRVTLGGTFRRLASLTTSFPILSHLASGRVGIEVVGGKALMMARNVSPEVSLRPKEERIGGAIFYIRCCNTDSYRKRMEAGFRL